jgi:hypothetical protein
LLALKLVQGVGAGDRQIAAELPKSVRVSEAFVRRLARSAAKFVKVVGADRHLVSLAAVGLTAFDLASPRSGGNGSRSLAGQGVGAFVEQGETSAAV